MGEFLKVGLYLGVEPRAGGMFQYAQSMLEALTILPHSRYDVKIAYGDSRWTPILDRLGLQGNRLRYWRLGSKMADILMALRLPARASRWVAGRLNPLVSELQKFNCHVWIFPAQEALSYQVRQPTIATVHDLMHRYERSFPEVGSLFRYAIREHRFSNLAHHSLVVLVDSEVGRQHVVESYQVDTNKVFALPYVAPSYLGTTTARQDFDQHYRLPSKFFFYPAQFWSHKNHLRLIDAIFEASKSCSDMALVLSGGEDHNYQSVKRRVQDLGLGESIKFVGYVPDNDLGEFYRRARGLVMPTFFGPTNIPPLEAMTMACPVLVSGIYGIPEQCGDAALYFDPNSVRDISKQLIKLWTDDELFAEMKRKGKMQVAKYGQKEFNERIAKILGGVRQQLLIA
jgi:glycosyltransferase involved in cell wall biosynthesis